jgi:hypothetical protein
MKPQVTMALLAVATAMNGVLAGAGIVRLLVDMPAWRHVGALAWADFSRHADLGNGLVLYPLLGIGGALATIGAVVAYRVGGGAPRVATVPIYLGGLLASLGMVTTAFAAPQMLSLRAPLDANAIQHAFDRFELWGGIRAVVQVLAAGANVWAIACVPRGDRRADQ